MNSLMIERTTQGSTLTLKLSGQIDEDANYSSVSASGFKKVVFDFEKIKLINSTGLQRWIKFLESLEKGVDIAFTRCSIRVVTQINMFPGFIAGRNVKVESFFAPYFCEKCDASTDLLVEVAAHAEELTAMKAPRMKCPTCGGEAEFDGIEKKYLVFLKPS